MLCILALDLATTTGWALRSSYGSILSGSESFAPQGFEGGGMRLVRFNAFLLGFTNYGRIDRCYFEEVRRHSGTDASHIYGGLMHRLGEFCETHEIPYRGVPVGTIKKHSTGSGNASKDAVVQAMRKKGHRIHSYDEADALALLYWAIENTPS